MTRFDLRLQDCVTGMASVPDQPLDLVFTSPPYNLGIRYRKFSDRQDRRLYLNWCAELGRTDSAHPETERLIVSQYWRRAVESDVATRNRDDIAQFFCAAE